MAKQKIKFIKPVHYLNLTIQNLHVQRHFPEFRCQINKSCARWRGFLQPRSTSPVYQVEIEYKLKQVPIVKVVKPILAPKAPHMYRDGRLCLYWPKEWMWQQDELIAKTIIPWAASWLYYYELWLDIGTWLGPSSHITLK